MFFLKIAKDIIAIFREGQTPAQVAGGFALGTLMGFSPMFTLQGAVVWLVLMSLDVNIGAATVAITLCKLIAYMIDPLFHWLGFQILTQVAALQPLWIWMYNAPLAPLTRFYNTVVMGSFVFAAALFVPVYYGMKKLVIAYRAHLHSRVEKWKIYQLLSQSKFVDWYKRARNFGALS